MEANPNHNVWNVWSKLKENRPSAHRMHIMAASYSHQDAANQNASMPFRSVMWTNAAQSEGTKNAYKG